MRVEEGISFSIGYLKAKAAEGHSRDCLLTAVRALQALQKEDDHKIEVFVALRGEASEGKNVLGVYFEWTKAHERIMQEKPHFGPWVAADETLNLYRSGCDEAEIESWIVE